MKGVDPEDILRGKETEGLREVTRAVAAAAKVRLCKRRNEIEQGWREERGARRPHSVSARAHTEAAEPASAEAPRRPVHPRRAAAAACQCVSVSLTVCSPSTLCTLSQAALFADVHAFGRAGMGKAVAGCRAL